MTERAGKAESYLAITHDWLKKNRGRKNRTTVSLGCVPGTVKAAKRKAEQLRENLKAWKKEQRMNFDAQLAQRDQEIGRLHEQLQTLFTTRPPAEKKSTKGKKS